MRSRCCAATALDAKEEHWELTLQCHLDAQTPGEEQREELLAKRFLSAEEDAAKIDREQQLINFTYQFTRMGRTEFVNVLALSQEQADKQFACLQPAVTRYTVSVAPLTEVTQRTFASLHRNALRQYFETCGINPDTGEGETTQDAMKAAIEQLLDPERIDVFNNVLRFGGYSSKKAKPKQPAAVFKQICDSGPRSD